MYHKETDYLMFVNECEDSFESAHLLSFYKGKCANLHGHSYKVKVGFECDPDYNGKFTDENDFSELKKSLNELCDEFDHAIIFSDIPLMSEREKELYEWAQKWDMNFIVLPSHYSTSEGIADYIHDYLNTIYPNRIVELEVWETSSNRTKLTWNTYNENEDLEDDDTDYTV